MSDMSDPVVSCITPTFNRADILPRAIESTLRQTFPDWEMIIVDDGSEDNTEEVVARYIEQDSRIRYFKNPGKGGNAARNHGIRQARGEWIAFLDDDVENLPKRFEKSLWAVQKLKSRFLISGVISYDKNGNTITHSVGWWAKAAPMTSCWFIKRELLFKAGLFDENMPAMQDAELSYRVSEYETFANYLQPLTIEYNTAESVSKGENGLLGKIMLLEKHKHIMPDLEAAWHIITLGIKYYALGQNKKSLKCLKQAAMLDSRKIYAFAWYYAQIFFNFGKPFKLINMKVLQYLSGYKYPKLIEHPYVD